MPATAAMTTIPAHKLMRDNVFEMFGNLYQVDAVESHVIVMTVFAHIIAQVGTPLLKHGRVRIHLDAMTPVQIEA